jgi:hypothetical protein
MIEIKFDTSAFDELAEKFASIDFSSAVSRALNRVGDMVTTAVGRELASETGMHVHDVRDAMDQERSTPGDLTYTITILGGYTSLAEFRMRHERESAHGRGRTGARSRARSSARTSRCSGACSRRDCRSRNCSVRTSRSNSAAAIRRLSCAQRCER